MKGFLLTITLIVFTLLRITGGNPMEFERKQQVWQAAPKSIDIALLGVMYQETRFGVRRVSKQSIAEGSVGLLQIQKGMVDYLNKRIGYSKYSYDDRYNDEKSIQMFYDYQSMHNPEGDVDLACHIWNAGNGRVAERWHLTEAYRSAVNTYINKNLRY